MSTPPTPTPTAEWQRENSQVVNARIQGSGRQHSTTDCLEFQYAVVEHATAKAVLLDIPGLLTQPQWIAKSQLGHGADIDRTANSGDMGTVRVPLYIVKGWMMKAQRTT